MNEFINNYYSNFEENFDNFSNNLNMIQGMIKKEYLSICDHTNRVEFDLPKGKQ